MNWVEWYTWGKQQPWYENHIKWQHEVLFKDNFMLHFQNYLPDPPKIVGERGREIFQALQISGTRFRVRDSRWKYTTKEEVERFLKWYKDTTIPSSFNDCNKYSSRCAGMLNWWCPGMAQGQLDLIDPGHSRNFIYVKEGMMQFEPRGFKLSPIEPNNIRFLDAT